MGSLYIAYKMRRSTSTPLEILRKQRYKKLILNKTLIVVGTKRTTEWLSALI